MIVLNDLLNYKDLKIYQDNESFVFSLDSIILPNFITINKNTKRILDIGTGNAPIPLILSTKTNAKIVGVEIQESIALLAKKSVSYNKLDGQIEIINKDIKEADFEAESFDIVLSNPPYFKVAEKSYLSEIINMCKKYNLEVKRLQFVYPKRDSNANIVLVEAIKNGNSGVKVLEPIITYENGEYTDKIKNYFKGSD